MKCIDCICHGICCKWEDKQKGGCIEKEPCEDAVSRQSVIDYLQEVHTKGMMSPFRTDAYAQGIINAMLELTSVTPQRKTGHWIRQKCILGDESNTYECSLCGRTIYCYEENELEDYPFCHCGAKMVEIQESELENPFDDSRFGG